MNWTYVRRLATGLVFVIVSAVPARGGDGIVYVDGQALPSGDGRSWATAYRYLQDALAAANAEPADGSVEMRVAQGIYRPDCNEARPQGSGNQHATFELNPGMHLLGGYGGTMTADPNWRDTANYPTILSGDLAGDDADVRDPNKLPDEPTRADNSWNVLQISGPAVLDGVTITGGHAPVWRFEYIKPDLGMSGGGAGVTGEGTIIRNCVFRANFASGGGAALELMAPVRSPHPDVLLVGCTFDGNVVRPGSGLVSPQGNGGAITLLLGTVILRECVFRGNQAAWGGCIATTGPGHVEMVNCLAVGNTASGGGAVLYNENGSAKVQNCTAVGNRAPAGRFLFDKTARPDRGKQPPSIQIVNCILANGGNEISDGYAATTIRFTNLVGGKSTIDDPHRATVWGPGSIDADPCFAYAGFWDANGTPEDQNDDLFIEGDYHLKSRAGRWDPAAWVQDDVTSTCVDAGDPATPFEDEPRPNGSRVNMGFYGGTAEASKSDTAWRLMTTQGPLLAGGLGVVLPHEHIFTDLRGPTVAGYGQADPADVVRIMKPWLVAARQKGVGVLFECSSIGVGRNVAIIDRVARESGLPVVVPTGVYGRDNFAPPEHQNMTEDELTTLFIKEIREGIEDTGIRAGFIKIATGSGAMTPLEDKVLRAAGRAAQETGAAIASHTPLGSNASRQVAILESIAPGIRFIWVHAQNESNRALHRQLAARGVYVEFDSLGSNPGQDTTLITAIQELLAAGYGSSVLLSHDAGWYQPGQPNGGTQRSYTYLIDTFIPKLRSAGVDDATIRMTTETNPVRALGFKSAE